MPIKAFFVTLFVMFVLCACGDKVDPGDAVTLPDGDGTEQANCIAYQSRIKDILDARCISCHSSALVGSDRNSAPAGYDYNTYSNTVATADSANSAIQNESMPKNGSMPESERADFQSWIESGTPGICTTGSDGDLDSSEE